MNQHNSDAAERALKGQAISSQMRTSSALTLKKDL